MAKGKAKVNLLHRAGLVGHSNAPDWGFIYETSLIQSDKWNIGDHVKLADGREFVYSKSSGVCVSGQASHIVATGAIPYTLLSADAAVGDRQISFVASTHSAIAKDELRGGFVVLWSASNKDMTRGIIGNDVSANGAAITIYLDGPLTVACTTATPGEAYENPYANLVNAGGGDSQSTVAKAGIPATYVGAASTYFWVQIRGFVFIACQTDMIDNKIGGYFRADGSVQADQAFSGLEAGNDTTQYAGHRVIGDNAGNGPLFYLQG